MGEEGGKIIVTEAQKKTFGGSIWRLSRSEHLPKDVLVRFQALLKDRNWLVHSSKADSKKALNDEAAYVGLHRKLESIVEESAQLLREILALSEKFVLGHGVSMADLETRTAEILKEWQSEMAHPELNPLFNAEYSLCVHEFISLRHSQPEGIVGPIQVLDVGIMYLRHGTERIASLRLPIAGEGRY